jgi:Pol polyprotein
LELTDGDDFASVFTAHDATTYTLRDSIIVYSSATVPICNDLQRMTEMRPVKKRLYAGDQVIEVTRVGTMVVNFTDEEGKERVFTALDAYYVPRFHTNCISENRLRRKGFWLRGLDDTLRHGDPHEDPKDDRIICFLKKHHRQRVMEYKPISA